MLGFYHRSYDWTRYGNLNEIATMFIQTELKEFLAKSRSPKSWILFHMVPSKGHNLSICIPEILKNSSKIHSIKQYISQQQNDLIEFHVP